MISNPLTSACSADCGERVDLPQRAPGQVLLPRLQPVPLLHPLWGWCSGSNKAGRRESLQLQFLGKFGTFRGDHVRAALHAIHELAVVEGFHVFEEGALAESPSICSRARTNASTDSGLPFPSFTRPRIPRCVAFVDAQMSVKEFR